MSENNKIGTYHFVAEPFHVDFTGRLTLGVLGNHLLNCAGFHATERGFGMAELNEENYTWVLSRLAIDMDEMPLQYEAISVQTWVENVYRLFTDRNFAILDKNGRKIGYARSVWAMISMQTRKPIDLLAINDGDIVNYVCDEPCPIEKPSRIKVQATEPVASLTARYSDIDINGHVNSIRYIEHILDMLPQKAVYYFTQPSVPRALPKEQLYAKATAKGLRGSMFATVPDAFRAALNDSTPDDMIYIGGSTFIVADFLSTR